MLECADTSFTGITVDLKRRLEEHSNGKGAKIYKEPWAFYGGVHRIPGHEGPGFKERS